MGKKKKVEEKVDVEIRFLLDRTGSMHGVVSDVIGGFNSFLADQRRVPGTCRFIRTLFDSTSIDTETYESISDVPDLTTETYVPRASTPLLDAMGQAISHEATGAKAERTLFVVYTDGEENASREFTKPQLKKLIEDKQAAGWDFIFLGADIDAYHEAGSIGLKFASTVTTDNSNVGATMDSLGASVSSYRAGSTDYMAPLRTTEEDQKKQKEGSKT